MLRKSLIFALRGLAKNKIYSVINIIGLALVIGDIDDNIRKSIGPIMTEFKNTPGVLNVSVSDCIPGVFSDKSTVIPEGYSAEEAKLVDIIDVDHNFMNSMGIELVAGRNFSPDIVSDSLGSLILNETAAREFVGLIIVASLIALIMALTTITILALKAALANPVKSIRTE